MVAYENEHVYDVYEAIASNFSITRSYEWSWIREFHESLRKNSNILDIGCGNGRNIEFYRHLNHIQGIDTSHEFVRICQEKGLSVIQGNMCNMPYGDETFDALTVIASFHHLDCVDHRITALSEMNRILKPGGKILMSVWSKEQPKKTRRVFEANGDTLVPWKSNDGKVFERYYYIFKKDELENLITNAGFKIDSWEWECGNEVIVLTKTAT
jgi:ubiquinone/menaquinone biosynthesis C-methylase UbiE